MSSSPLSERAGIVTGAAGGIGRAITEAVVTAGASVLAVDRDAERLRELPAAPAVVAREVDVTSTTELGAAVAACTEQHGGVDFVVANAGVGWFGDFEDGDAEDWERVLGTNVVGTALTLRAALPALRRSEVGGHIVVTASVSGLVAYPGESLYIASKWAVVGLLRSLRLELAGTGVRLTSVEPGLVDTPLARRSPVARDWLETTTALQPADVAAAVAYALGQARHVDVNEIVLRPHGQAV